MWELIGKVLVFVIVYLGITLWFGQEKYLGKKQILFYISIFIAYGLLRWLIGAKATYVGLAIYLIIYAIIFFLPNKDSEKSS